MRWLHIIIYIYREKGKVSYPDGAIDTTEDTGNYVYSSPFIVRALCIALDSRLVVATTRKLLLYYQQDFVVLSTKLCCCINKSLLIVQQDTISLCTVVVASVNYKCQVCRC